MLQLFQFVHFNNVFNRAEHTFLHLTIYTAYKTNLALYGGGSGAYCKAVFKVVSSKLNSCQLSFTMEVRIAPVKDERGN